METTNLVEVEIFEVHLLEVKVILVLKLGELQGLFQSDPQDIAPPHSLVTERNSTYSLKYREIVTA